MGRSFACMAIAMLALDGCGRISFALRDDAGAGDAAAGECRFIDVAVGGKFTCALGSDGSVWCWGANDSGQVTSPPGADSAMAVRVVLPSPASEVGAGKYSACARLVEGSVWCWGGNDRGQLGNGMTQPSSPPTQVLLSGETALELDVGGEHACVRRASDSAIMCWGHNKAFALGNMTPESAPQTTPTVVASTAGTKRLALGHRHACGLDSTDQVFCWGRGLESQLGVGTANSATAVRPPGLVGVQSIDAANRLTCVVLAGGEVRCWGSRYLGGSNFDTYPSTPLVTDGIAVATGHYMGCAVHSTGTVSCWGYLVDQAGALTTAVTPLAGVIGAEAIESGWYHYCALTTGGLVCWGADDSGQLGHGTIGGAPAPGPVTVSCN